MTYTEGFDSDGLADELAFAFGVFLALMALWEVVQSVIANHSPERSQTDQHITLNEDALRRLEDGETVVVRRWHGQDLELSGTRVIDVETVEDEQTDD